MGQLCSRPRTVEDKHLTDPLQTSVPVNAESGHRQQTGPSPHVHDLHSEVTQHVLLESQGSDAELSELDLVVQQLHNNQNSVTGSAPELLQQWDRDHRVVLESIDASIQVQACSLFKTEVCVCSLVSLTCFVPVQRAQHQHHRAASSSPVVPASRHIPAVYLHTASPVSNTKLGNALQSAPPPLQHSTQQAPVPLEQEPLLIQAKQAYAGSLSFMSINVWALLTADIIG